MEAPLLFGTVLVAQFDVLSAVTLCLCAASSKCNVIWAKYCG